MYFDYNVISVFSSKCHFMIIKHVCSVLITNSIVRQQCAVCSYKPPQTFFKAQFHFKTQKQRFSDDLKVKSVVGDCDDQMIMLFVLMN